MSAQPFDLDAEVAVIGALLIDPEAHTTLRPEEFYAERHRVAYESIAAMRDRGDAPTPLTLVDHLKSRGAFERAGGYDYVALYWDASPAGVEHHARIVRNKALLRRLITACQATMQDAMEAGDVGEVFQAAEARLLEATSRDRRNTGGFRPVGDAVHEAMEMIERAANANGGIVGMRTGLPKLDMMTSGLEPGGLTVLAARPAMGKSALGWQLAERAAMDGHGVAVASYEMGAGQLGRRGLARLSKIDSNVIRRAELGPDEWKALAIAGNRLAELPIWIDDRPPAEVEGLRSMIQRHRTRHDVNLVVVDYLQQMSGPKKSGNRNNEVEHISRGLKRIAMDMDVHVIALAQLSRGVESRTPPRPILSDLRDSGAIEQDADNVLLLWRPEYYFTDRTSLEAQAEWQGKAEAILAKQRDGETGRILMAWDAPRLMFTQIDDRRNPRTERRAG